MALSVTLHVYEQIEKATKHGSKCLRMGVQGRKQIHLKVGIHLGWSVLQMLTFWRGYYSNPRSFRLWISGMWNWKSTTKWWVGIAERWGTCSRWHIPFLRLLRFIILRVVIFAPCLKSWRSWMKLCISIKFSGGKKNPINVCCQSVNSLKFLSLEKVIHVYCKL